MIYERVGGHEAELEVIALMVHSRMISVPTGIVDAKYWGIKAKNHLGAHGSSHTANQCSSAPLDNGPAFVGLGVTHNPNGETRRNPE